MNNKLVIALGLLLCVAVGVAVYFWQENRISSLIYENERLQENTEEIDEELTSETSEEKKVTPTKTGTKATINDFKYDERLYDYYGKLVVEGYVTTEEWPEAFCEENCQMYTYVFFNVLNTENDFFDAYIERQLGNAFVGERSIGLGCVKNNILWRINDSDEFGPQEYTNSVETSALILNSTAERPITIQLERYLLRDGRGAPDCYSHFAQVRIVE
jgi:hypothetical protein